MGIYIYTEALYPLWTKTIEKSSSSVLTTTERLVLFFFYSVRLYKVALFIPMYQTFDLFALGKGEKRYGSSASFANFSLQQLSPSVSSLLPCFLFTFFFFTPLLHPASASPRLHFPLPIFLSISSLAHLVILPYFLPLIPRHTPSLTHYFPSFTCLIPSTSCTSFHPFSLSLSRVFPSLASHFHSLSSLILSRLFPPSLLQLILSHHSPLALSPLHPTLTLQRRNLHHC